MKIPLMESAIRLNQPCDETSTYSSDMTAILVSVPRSGAAGD
jgi:hypothetical protein